MASIFLTSNRRKTLWYRNLGAFKFVSQLNDFLDQWFPTFVMAHTPKKS